MESQWQNAQPAVNSRLWGGGSIFSVNQTLFLWSCVADQPLQNPQTIKSPFLLNDQIPAGLISIILESVVSFCFICLRHEEQHPSSCFGWLLTGDVNSKKSKEGKTNYQKISKWEKKKNGETQRQWCMEKKRKKAFLRTESKPPHKPPPPLVCLGKPIPGQVHAHNTCDIYINKESVCISVRERMKMHQQKQRTRSSCSRE